MLFFLFFFYSGKARRGDGNDLTPNAKKLAAIGKELDQLSKVINDLTPVNEIPFNTRCKSRKEKNKLASRACRLKKKAQHEANKLKCNGLENEHRKWSEQRQMNEEKKHRLIIVFLFSRQPHVGVGASPCHPASQGRPERQPGAGGPHHAAGHDRSGRNQ